MTCCNCCCPEDEKCCPGQGPGGVCCKEGNCCGGQNCCEEGDTCCDGTCCKPGQTCCDGACCPPGKQCCDGVCKDDCSEPCPPALLCGNDCCTTDQYCCGGQECCEFGKPCCGGECCDDLSPSCIWLLDCEGADPVFILPDFGANLSPIGCIKIVLGAYDAGVNSPSTQSSGSSLLGGGFPLAPGFSSQGCPVILFALTRNANCEMAFPDGSKGGGEVTETQYKAYRASCSGGDVVDISDEAVAEGYRGVLRFDPDPGCSTPGDPPLLDWLDAEPVLVCPP